MTTPEIYLLCFAVGVLWSIATLLLGGMHSGHGSGAHAHAGPGHFHGGHGQHALHAPQGQHGSQGLHGNSDTHGHSSPHGYSSWLASMINPSGIAVFLAWFGGIGYLLTRHTGWVFWIDMAIALAAGLTGTWILGSFLRFLQSREKPLDPADYQMVGVLGRVSSPIRRENGVGEVIYVRDGTRRPVAARSEDGTSISRGEEVVVIRFEKGIAFVRTWDAMLQPGHLASAPETLPREKRNVE